MTVYNLKKCYLESYLTTKESISCPSCTEPAVLRGQHSSVVPVYVLYREHNDFLEAAYRMFFPYNRGKRVCIGYYAHNICPCFEVWCNCVCPRIRGCIGGYSTFDHHVGDWENVIVRFRKVFPDYQIYSLYLSTHNTEITNKFAGDFLWKDGKFRKGSQSLAMHGGTKHAIDYSAEGSHGIWPAAGRHVYKILPNKDELVDYTSDGLSWQTWDNLKIVKYDPSYRWSSLADGETKKTAAAPQSSSAVNAYLITVQQVPPIKTGLILDNCCNGFSGCYEYCVELQLIVLGNE